MQSDPAHHDVSGSLSISRQQGWNLLVGANDALTRLALLVVDLVLTSISPEIILAFVIVLFKSRYGDGTCLGFSCLEG